MKNFICKYGIHNFIPISPRSTMRDIGITIIHLFICCILYSCSSDEIDKIDINSSGQPVKLSISFESSKEQTSLRSVGNPDIIKESTIYSLMVFIFNPSTGARDGFAYLKASEIGEESLIEITDISLTSGLRDIYVIANPIFDEYLQNIDTYDNFKKLGNHNYTPLSDQGGITDGDTGGEGPIGGITPEYNINLTMIGKALNVQFDNTATNHYWGYGDVGTGKVLDTNPFELERLVARVAVQKIELNFTGKSLDLEGTLDPIESTNYSVYIDKVFMINTQNYVSTFGFNKNVDANYEHYQQEEEELGYGFGSWDDEDNVDACSNTHTFLTNNMNNYNQYLGFPMSSLTALLNLGRNYDIEKSDSPVWFYAFENYKEEDHPTMLIIALRFTFRSKAEPGKIKISYAYYPIIVNRPDNGYTEHNYIRPNNQYGLQASISGLGYLYDVDGASEYSFLKKLSKSNINQIDCMEVSENVGKDLFPWTGNKYKN